MKKVLAMLLCGIVFSSGYSLVAQNYWECPPNLTPIQCGYYQEAYQDGAADAQNNRSNDYRRYRSKLDGSKYESYYRQGYDAGFSSIQPYQRWDKNQRNAYDSGYSKGANDKRRNISSLPQRYEGDYDRNQEAYFNQGYYDGYDGRNKQYDTQIGYFPNNRNFPNANPSYNPSYNPPFSSPNFRMGTETGTVSWNGRVDDRTNIIIRDDQVSDQIIAGNGSYTNSRNISGVLPRVSSNISIRKQKGRGDAIVIQQPSRDNNYTAIVQVSDAKRGADDYSLQITWQAIEPLEEPYQSGRVYWRGRVDQTANIIVSGNSVQTQDSSGTGVFDINYNISGHLARRPGAVSVRKNRGRGTVTVLQQPSYENGFTAIVQIFDNDRGAGDYEIEVSW